MANEDAGGALSYAGQNRPMRPKHDPLAVSWSTLIRELGYDPADAHLKDSPRRIARFLREWHTRGKGPPEVTTFPAKGLDQMVVTSGLRFYSLCAHHGLPFFGTAAIAYVPDKVIAGLSKFARVLDHFARRFQTQEDLAHEVAEYLGQTLKPRGVGVILSAEHLCMSMRGIQRPGHTTTASELRGVLRDAAPRAEFMMLARL